jgi:hypothetical protein
MVDLPTACALDAAPLELTRLKPITCGGVSQLSTTERAIIQRAAVTNALAEHLETRWLNGEEIDPNVLVALGNAFRRFAETIGLKRRPKNIQRDDEMQQLWTEAVASLDDDAVQEAT